MTLPTISDKRIILVTILTHPASLDYAIPLVFLAFWTTGFSVVKIGLRSADPFTFLALRYVFVLLILLPVQIVLRLPTPRGIRKLIDLCIIGFLIQFVYFGGTYLALRQGLSAGTLAVIVSMQPILVGVIAPIWVKESIAKIQWVGLTFGFLGTLIVILSKSTVSLNSLQSIGYAFAALFGLTFGMLYEKKRSSSTNIISATLIQSAVGLAFVLPLALALDSWHIEWSLEFIFSLSYLVIFNSIISIILLLFLMRHRQATKVAALFFLVPPGAAIVAHILLGERLFFTTWIGIAIATFGVLLSTLNEISKRA
jgi:drug/metabolite transporter (DMT)-like permease